MAAAPAPAVLALPEGHWVLLHITGTGLGVHRPPLPSSSLSFPCQEQPLSRGRALGGPSPALHRSKGHLHTGLVSPALCTAHGSSQRLPGVAGCVPEPFTCFWERETPRGACLLLRERETPRGALPAFECGHSRALSRAVRSQPQQPPLQTQIQAEESPRMLKNKGKGCY